MNYMKSYKTMTGMPLEDGLRALVEILPPQAYKSTPGAAGLTDIDPSFLTQVATKVFGLCGMGWSIHYNPDLVQVEQEERTSKSGRTYTVFMAHLPYLEVAYRYVDENGTLNWSAPIPANGGSENEQHAWAVRGAITNAIGAAFSKLCWQLLVYQGVVSHENAAALYKKQQAKTEQPAVVKAEPVAQVEPVAPAAEPVAQVEPAVEEAVHPDETVEYGSLEWAKGLVIPDDVEVPLTGKALGQIMGDQMGMMVLKFLAGNISNARNQFFAPTGQEQENLKHAAALVLSTQTNGTKSKAKS
jgi:hypothetical protein